MTIKCETALHMSDKEREKKKHLVFCQVEENDKAVNAEKQPQLKKRSNQNNKRQRQQQQEKPNKTINISSKPES